MDAPYRAVGGLRDARSASLLPCSIKVSFVSSPMESSGRCEFNIHSNMLAAGFAYLSETMAVDRRDFQRLRLAKPILSLLDGQNALILDIGIGGVFIEHYGTFPPRQRFRLLFRWKSDDVEYL